MRFARLTRAALVAAVATLVLAGPVGATALAPNPELTTQGTGLAVASDGIGLEDLGAGTADLSVLIGGPVQKAFFYWAGRDLDCTLVADECVVPAEPYLDQEMVFDGVPVVGTIVGTEGQAPPQPYFNIGYRADVTEIVQARGTGVQAFSVADGNLASNLDKLNGGALLVLYIDPMDPIEWRVVVFEGLDFAFGRSDQRPEALVAEPVVFGYEPEDVDRVASLTIFVGDARETRPDRIDISDNPSLVDQLVGGAGNDWDVLFEEIDVPAGVDSTSVVLVSEPIDADPNADSLLWELGVLRVPLIREDGGSCRVTGGGNDVSESLVGGMNRYTFGGQAGAPTGSQPQPRGEWTHHQQVGADGSFVFHAGTASAPDGTEIDLIVCSDPDWCVQARPAPFKQIDFEGVGTFRNVRNPSANLAGVVAGETYHWFEVHIEDLGEPGGGGGPQNLPSENCRPGGSEGTLAECDCPDYYRIRIYQAFDPAADAPNRSDLIYEGAGYVDHGNLQIHPAIR